MSHAVARVATVALLAASSCGGDDGRGGDDPTASVVAVEASGCRLRPIHAVGTVVGEDLVLTVAHAVAGEDEVFVTTDDGRRLPADVAAIDTERDAAVLRIDGLGLDPLSRRDAESTEAVRLLLVEEGEVRTEPAEVRRRVTLRTSDIYRQGEHLRPGLEVAGEVRAGDSGGAVVGEDGRLVGIVWARSREADNRAWATRIEVVEPLLADIDRGRPPAEVACSR